MNPLIICLVGESGSGKTALAEAIQDQLGVAMIESYTDRPRRHPNERGHTFISSQEFDKLDVKDMIAYTKFGQYRYCCLHSDVIDENTYVIDEFGALYLKQMFSDRYDIITIRLKRPVGDRIQSVGSERVRRDMDMFRLHDDWYDIVMYNSDTKDGFISLGLQTVQEILKNREDTIKQHYQSFDCGGH